MLDFIWIKSRASLSNNFFQWTWRLWGETSALVTKHSAAVSLNMAHIGTSCTRLPWFCSVSCQSVMWLVRVVVHFVLRRERGAGLVVVKRSRVSVCS